MSSRRALPIKKIVAGIIIAVLIALLLWGVQWATYARPPLPEAIDALQSDDRITVVDDP